MSFLASTGASESTCGYCHSRQPTSKSHGAWAYSISPSAYQALIDHGWRRSGQYLYKPSPDTCCKAYTIRLDATRFCLSKSQKKTIRKMKKFVVDGVGNLQTGAGEMETDEEGTSAIDERFTGKRRMPQAMQDMEMSENSRSLDVGLKKDVDLDADGPIGKLLLAAEGLSLVSKNPFKIELVPAKLEDETFQLYKRYQIAIHKDPEDKLSPESFKRFLVDSPIQFQPINESSRISGYGSFHQKYYIDNHLVAVGVIDILPHCVSSVYFMYDPSYAFLSLGVYGAIREIGLTWSLAKALPKLKYYYMGYYIHSCPKMRYKANYKPSDLLCPSAWHGQVTYNWVPVEESLPKLDASPFSALSGSSPSNQDQASMISIEQLKLYQKGRLVLFKDSRLSSEEKEDVRLLVDVLGPSLALGFVYVV